ncbi:hypothetical protein [Methylobacterium oryzisoli]|uniref:hypothetical protein n=1 Tax=Methylobacterium oryzisoli TaxID=3385502 RepID=UPI003891D4A9
MKPDAVTSTEMPTQALPPLGADIRRRLGHGLRKVYERTSDGLPLTTEQIQLLLRLRHRERELQRSR